MFFAQRILLALSPVRIDCPLRVSPRPRRIERAPDNLYETKSSPLVLRSFELTQFRSPLRPLHTSPEIGAGVGGLMYNAIFGYLDIVTGGSRLMIGIAKIKQCAKVFVR